MTVKHTPPPYEVFSMDDTPSGANFGIRSTTGNPLGHPRRIATIHATGFDGEAEANARLFGVAGEMYSLLKRVLPIVEQYRCPGPAMSDPWHPPWGTIKAIKTIIATVEGQA